MIVVVFRGTLNLNNWYRDLQFIQPEAPFPNSPAGSRVHYGFLKVWEYLKPNMTKAIADLVREYHFPVYVMGHSLGGAVANLAAYDIHSTLGIETVQIVMIAINSPRIGNSVFARWLKTIKFKQFIRLVNQNDLIPHLPIKLMQFEHTPTEVWVKNENDTVVCERLDGDGETNECANSLVSFDINKHLSIWEYRLGTSGCTHETLPKNDSSEC